MTKTLNIINYNESICDLHGEVCDLLSDYANLQKLYKHYIQAYCTLTNKDYNVMLPILLEHTGDDEESQGRCLYDHFITEYLKRYTVEYHAPVDPILKDIPKQIWSDQAWGYADSEVNAWTGKRYIDEANIPEVTDTSI